MTEFGRYLKRCPAALKDKTRTLSLLKDALNNDLPKFRVLQAAYELGILETIQRSNPISTDDRQTENHDRSCQPVCHAGKRS